MNLLKNNIFISVFLLSVFFSFTVKADAATLYLTPSSSNITVGNISTVNILVNTDGVAINNAEVVVNFPKDLLEIVSVSKSGSIFSLWVAEPVFSNGSGTLSFNGGAPTPGFNGSADKALSVVFRAKNTGSATLLFSSSSVRANDGFGTDVLTGTGQANINITAVKITPPPPAPDPISTPEAIPEVIPPVPVPLTPILIDYSKDVKENEYIVVKGVADPDTDIIINSNRILPDGGDAINDQIVIKSNDKGLFTYVSENRITAGIYIISAQARESSGVLSEKSLPIKISVSTKTISISTNIINILSTLIPIIGLLILLILLLIWGWYRIRKYREDMRRRLMQTRALVSKSFDILGEDVAEEIKIFKKIKARESLSDEERLFINQFKKDIESAEKAIADDIKEAQE
jgi:hypothetical protein